MDFDGLGAATERLFSHVCRGLEAVNKHEMTSMLTLGLKVPSLCKAPRLNNVSRIGLHTDP